MKGEYEIITFPFSDYDITETDEYKWADIIHLHWIGDFIDYKSFFKKNKKPLIWTLRDSNPLLGIFHLQNDLNKNSLSWKSLDQKMISLKNKYIKKHKSKIEIVGISKWMVNQSIVSKINMKFKHHFILNCININNYQIYNKN